MIKFIFIILLFNFIVACKSAKDAFTLKKKSSGDEFLVEKKSPLVMPPDYGKLPMPGEKQVIEQQTNENIDIKIILNDNKNLSNKVETNSAATSIEKSILEKIK
jgi:hypothetical protein